LLFSVQPQVPKALFTADMKYSSASTASIEVVYLRHLLENRGFAHPCPAPVSDDKTARIEWGNNFIGGRERAKHIDIRTHFVHEVVLTP
jgi:hypothetical protein